MVLVIAETGQDNASNDFVPHVEILIMQIILFQSMVPLQQQQLVILK